MTTLLLVNDPHLSLELQQRFGDREIKIISVSSGAIALEMIRKIKPALIILGYELEDVPGAEVHRNIKKHPQSRNIPLIILYDPKHGKVDSVPQGPQDEIISKPVQTEKLVERVARHLNIQLRRHNRIAIEMGVECAHDQQKLTGFARNISESGMFIETDADVQRGSHLTLSFTLPGQGASLEVPGEVARRIELKRQFRFGLGIRFSGLAQASRDQILGFLVQKSFQIIA
ncbi:MAG: PilZ domain-containing protein [Acidobacteriota bacterium]